MVLINFHTHFFKKTNEFFLFGHVNRILYAFSSKNLFSRMFRYKNYFNIKGQDICNHVRLKKTGIDCIFNNYIFFL